MTNQKKNVNISDNKSSSKQSVSTQRDKSSATSVSPMENAYVSSNLSAETGIMNQPQAGLIMKQTPNSTQSASSGSSSQRNQSQKMAYETGLDYTSDVIRQEKLQNKNQKAANSLIDRMYWQREESLSKSINVNDKGELEDYDDTPGFGNDKPGL